MTTPTGERISGRHPVNIGHLVMGLAFVGLVGVWAWEDEPRAMIRERVFAADAGVAEDEATGSAAMRLTSLLGREIEIHPGRGSLIRARPVDGGRAEIGGRVALDEIRNDPRAGGA